MTTVPSPGVDSIFITKNSILKRLPKEELGRLLQHLTKVKFKLGDVVYHPEQNIEFLYYPENVMISMIATTSEGSSAEIGVIGFEGIVGANAFLGATVSLTANIIQIAGEAWRIPVNAVKEAFKAGGKFQELSLQFVNVLIAQIGQTALCNRLHTVEERLSRWLLMCQDRSETEELNLSQEFLGIMLGVNRATVTLSAINLQSAGFIKYSRGKIVITDRDSLEHFSCECYRWVKKEYDRTFI